MQGVDLKQKTLGFLDRVEFELSDDGFLLRDKRRQMDECIDCGHKISLTCEVCPKCGRTYPVGKIQAVQNAKLDKWMSVLMWVCFGLLGLGLLFWVVVWAIDFLKNFVSQFHTI